MTTVSSEEQAHETVGQRIRRIRSAVRPAEQRVLEALSTDYPIAGLVPVVQLASKANVSTATVLRVVGKLGYPGYAAFQSALRSELSARLFSPADIQAPPVAGLDRAQQITVSAAEAATARSVKSTFANLQHNDLTRVVELLADVKRPIVIIGGHFTNVLASHLVNYLTIMRPSVSLSSPGARDRSSLLIDINERTTVVVFDYRRYQKNVIGWTHLVKQRGARLVLFTDQYLSPISSRADVVMMCDGRGIGRFDSLVSAHVLIDVVTSLVFDRLGSSAQRRLEAFEQFRSAEEGEPVG